MDTTVESMLDSHENRQAPISARSTLQILKWAQKLTLVTGLVGLIVYFVARLEIQMVLQAALGLITMTIFLELGLRLREHVRHAAWQNQRHFSHFQEILQRLDDGYDVVSPVTPTIELEGQALVVLRAWSANTGKATLLLDQRGRVIKDQSLWRQSIPLIEFANASLPGVARNRRAILSTNRFARNYGVHAWRRALEDNKDALNHLGLAAENQMLLEQWDVLETFLSLRIALFQAEETVVEQVGVPASDQAEITAWIDTQRRIHQSMATLAPGAEKVSTASARLLTGWLEHKSDIDWVSSDELEAGLKFAYLLQSLLKRTLERQDVIDNPDLKTFERGLDLARHTGLMIASSS